MIEGKDDLLEACRRRKMKLRVKAANLLESRIAAEGNLDGMDVRLIVNYICGMPGESEGTITIKGNVAQLLSVLARVWPAAPETRDITSPGRQSWPDRPRPRDKSAPSLTDSDG